jgi:hypothetical protein
MVQKLLKTLNSAIRSSLLFKKNSSYDVPNLLLPLEVIVVSEGDFVAQYPLLTLSYKTLTMTILFKVFLKSINFWSAWKYSKWFKFKSLLKKNFLSTKNHTLNKMPFEKCPIYSAIYYRGIQYVYQSQELIFRINILKLSLNKWRRVKITNPERQVFLRDCWLRIGRICEPKYRP